MATEQEMHEFKEKQDVLKEFREKKEDYPRQWKPIYEKCQAHYDFAMLGKQMDSKDRRGLKIPPNMKLPNPLKKYVNQQANQTLQVKYKSVVTPNGGGADIDKATARQSVLRGIQVPTCGPVYNEARRGQLAAAIHYSKVVVDYASQRGFEKSLRYEDVVDTWNVFPDPFVSTPTFGDMTDFLIRESVPKSKWKERTGMDWGFGYEKTKPLWYFWKKRSLTSEKEFLMLDGTEKLESELDGDMSQVAMDGDTPFGRDVSIYDWEWHMIADDGNKIIRSGDWKGCYPPLVACTGEKVMEQTASGMVTHFIPLTADAEEPALMYSTIECIIKMRLARSPYSKWIVPFESIISKQNGDLTESSIIGDMNVLYKSYTEDGKPIPAPNEREPYILDRLLIELQQVQLQKIEQILGIPSAVFGEKTNETSGIAIERRKREGDVSSYHYTFNFLEYVKQMGLVTLEAFPRYYTTEQQVAFMDKDDKAEMRTINGPDGLGFDPMERYSLVVEVQPDSDTDREAEADSLMAMAENPFLGPLILRPKGAAAIIVKSQKGRYAQELGEMLDQMNGDPEKDQMQQQIQAMQEEGKKLKAELDSVKADKSFEMLKEQNRSREAMAKLEIDKAKNADTTEIDAYNAETGRMKVDMIPKTPESILTADGELETDAVQGLENVVGELHEGESHQGIDNLHGGMGA